MFTFLKKKKTKKNAKGQTISRLTLDEPISIVHSPALTFAEYSFYSKVEDYRAQGLLATECHFPFSCGKRLTNLFLGVVCPASALVTCLPLLWSAGITVFNKKSALVWHYFRENWKVLARYHWNFLEEYLVIPREAWCHFQVSPPKWSCYHWENFHDLPLVASSNLKCCWNPVENVVQWAETLV